MAPAVERRDHVRRYASDRSNSPIRDRHSPRRKGSPRRDRPSGHRRSSPKMRSPTRTSSSHKLRSPVKEKLSDRARSPKHERPRSPVKEKLANRARSPKHERPRSPVRTSSSRSPSPHTKRLRRVRAEHEAEKVMDKDHGRNASREGRDKGRHSVHGDKRDFSTDRRLVRDKSDAGSMKSLRRSVSPDERSHRSRQRSRSPPRVPKARDRDEAMNVRVSEQSRDIDRDSVAKMNAAAETLEAKEKQKPSFELSGKLAEETNRVRGVTLLFNEPPDACKPDVRWRLYVFKAGEVLSEPLYIHRQSCYLFGRERRVADIPTDHPSCSKQHAVLQYRLVEKEEPDGLLSKQVRPYVMDLGSTNGTFINDNRIEPQRYYEIFEKDTIKFGNSSREYVLLHENSAG